MMLRSVLATPPASNIFAASRTEIAWVSLRCLGGSNFRKASEVFRAFPNASEWPLPLMDEFSSVITTEKRFSLVRFDSTIFVSAHLWIARDASVYSETFGKVLKTSEWLRRFRHCAECFRRVRKISEVFRSLLNPSECFGTFPTLL